MGVDWVLKRGGMQALLLCMPQIEQKKIKVVCG